MHLSGDDCLRRELWQQLYGYGSIARGPLEDRFGIGFDEHFAAELGRLRELVEQGLVEREAVARWITELLGRLLVRVVAAVFDRYLPPTAFRDGLPVQLASKVG
jgi:oxygen-independent coproporphyrinogen-3 oxidase